MYRHAPFRLFVFGVVFVLALAACSDDPNPSKQSFSLRVTLEGEGSVTLTTSDASVPEKTYRGDFARALPAGTVTLSADPADGSRFGAWGGDCEAEELTCTFTLDADKQVTLTFQEQSGQPQDVTLVVNKEGDGAGTVTSDPGGIDCGESCQVNYEGGTAVTLTATAAAGSSFTGWQGACETETSNLCTLNVTTDQSVTATFAPQAPTTYNVTVATTGEGQVTTADATLFCPDLCTAAYAANTQVTLSATPASGYTFERWEGACQGTESSCTVEVSGDQQVTAVFEAVAAGQTFTVSKGLAQGSDDAEEYLRAGCHLKFPDDCVVANEVELASDRSADDIDFGRDKIYGVDVFVGLRFTDLDIPQGAVITEARIQFQIDHGGSKPTSVTFRTQADAQAPTFAEKVGNISSRPTNAAAVDWQIGTWPDVEGKKDDPNALTPNLAAVVQEVIDHPEWQGGNNALVFLFSGEGQRQATSFEDSNNNAGQNTRLTVTYQLP